MKLYLNHKNMKTLTVKNNLVTIEYITLWVKKSLEMVNNNHPSQYLTVTVEEALENGDYYSSTIKLRVGNHSAKKQNNNCDTYSFISARCDQGYSAMINEWLVSDEEQMLTDTYEYVNDILEYELLDNLKLELF